MRTPEKRSLVRHVALLGTSQERRGKGRPTSSKPLLALSCGAVASPRAAGAPIKEAGMPRFAYGRFPSRRPAATTPPAFKVECQQRPRIAGC